MTEVPIDQIKPSPYQPRLYFDLEAIKESIKQDGMLVAPLVRRKPDGKTEYELIDGERRWRATKELGWQKIPIEIKNVDDETARRMVYILNEERQPYTLEENTKFFRRMYDQMGSAYAVAEAFGRHHSTIWQYINISILPEHFQKALWARKITTGFIQELEPLFTEARNEIGDIKRYTAYQKSPTYQRIIALCERIYTGDIKTPKELRKEYIDPYLESLDKKRLEKVKEEVEKVVPQHLIEAKEVKLETPEELERTAEILRKEAKKKREETLTAEDKVKIEDERKHKERERQEKAEELKRREEAERKEREEEVRRRVDDEARHRARQIEATERRQIEEETLKKAEEKLLKDATFLQKARAELSRIESTPSVREVKELEKIPKEMVVKEGTIYTVGEYECPHCKKHYLIKCNGKEDWVE